MEGIKNLLFREPARVVALVGAILAALAAFGINLSLQQSGSIVQLVVTALAVIGIILGANEVTRANVTPVADPVLPVGTPVNGGAAEVVPTGTSSPTPDDFRGEGV